MTAARMRAKPLLGRVGGLAVMALAILLGAACGGATKNEAGRLTASGRTEVGAPGEKITVVRGTEPIVFGQRVNVRQGTAAMSLSGSGGRQLELREGANVELALSTESASRVLHPGVLGGDVLAVTGEADLPLAAGNTEIVVHGSAQVAKGQSVVVTSYSGRVDVTVAGQTLSVPALRQVTVPAMGPLPSQPSPAAYDSGDAWDQRFLGDAVELGNELQARSQGFSAQLGPTDGRRAEFFRRLLPPLADQPTFTDASVAWSRPPGETLVGAAIALAGTRGSFEQRWAEVFAFRDQGASWGLVALDQGVTRPPLVAAVDDASGRGPSLITPGAPSGQDGGGGGIALPTPPSDGGAATPGNGGQAGTDPPTGAPATTVPQSGQPPDATGPLNTGIGPIDDLVNALVDTLSGLLRGLGGG